MIKRNGIARRTLDQDVLDSATWLIKTWRLLLEKHVGITMREYCLRDKLLVVVPDAARKFQALFNSCGVTYLCMELISVGIDHALVIECIYLLVALLLGPGNDAVQTKIGKYLIETDSALFFCELGEILELLTLWSAREFELRDDNKSFSQQLPKEIAMFKLLQLINAGNFDSVQNFMRDQGGNSRAVPLLSQLATYSRLESHRCSQMSIHLVQTIHSLIQGPCHGNQDQFVLQTELLFSLNRIIRTVVPMRACTHEWLGDIERLKECALDVLRATIEDQPEDSVILERVAASIELNVLHVLLIPEDNMSHEAMDIEELQNLWLSPLQAKYLVFKHTLHEKTKHSAFNMVIQTSYAKVVTFVEILWNGSIHRHYFHIPDIVHYLTPLTKEMLYDAMDSPTHEIQLRNFLKTARRLFIEATNQRALRNIGFGNIGGWKKRILLLMFLNAMVMNVLMMGYFVKRQMDGSGTHRALEGCSTSTSDSSAVNYMDDTPKRLIIIFNVIQVILSVATVTILAFVRVPTTYISNLESGVGTLNALVKTACDPIPLWYTSYLLFTLLGLFHNPLFLSILLLDFALLEPSVKGVLFAVLSSWRQLLSTKALIGIVGYIFAAIIFQLYASEIILFVANSLWDVLKIAVLYGSRGGYGISWELSSTLNNRVIMDVVYFIVMIEILRAVFQAIVLDGFSKLRELKTERCNMPYDYLCIVLGNCY